MRRYNACSNIFGPILKIQVSFEVFLESLDITLIWVDKVIDDTTNEHFSDENANVYVKLTRINNISSYLMTGVMKPGADKHYIIYFFFTFTFFFVFP